MLYFIFVEGSATAEKDLVDFYNHKIREGQEYVFSWFRDWDNFINYCFLSKKNNLPWTNTRMKSILDQAWINL